MRNRGFEVISTYQGQNLNLPERKTQSSAGYDIAAAEEIQLLPHKVSLIPTGLKAYMLADEYLSINIRSGVSIKQAVSLINGQGIIDADYYNNAENEGHIMIACINHSDKVVVVHKGMRVAQGIFVRYLTTDDDTSGGGKVRSGGMGSTGER